MLMKNLITQNQTVRQLLGNGLEYRVPSFQRDYSWTESEWDDLWQDILNLFDEDVEPAHYMGYLVLQSEDAKKFEIIDGQQRITTITICILAALMNLKTMSEKNIDAESNKVRYEGIYQSFIGYIDFVTLATRPKLTLNRHNDRYLTHVVTLTKLTYMTLNSSEQLLKKAYEYYCQKIEKYAGNIKGSGEKVAELIETIADKLFFTVMTTSDELNAFTVFETLNSRGVRLSSTDLLKNYLFSLMIKEHTHESVVKRLENIWENILSELSGEDFSEFLRIAWNSQNKLARKLELFKIIRSEIKTIEQASTLLNYLTGLAPILAALKNPDSHLWNNSEKEAVYLFKIAGISQPFSLLLSAFHKFYESDRTLFTKIMNSLKVITFRYNIISNLQTNEKLYIFHSQSNLCGTRETRRPLTSDLDRARI